jgi:hypothetical protein
MNTLRRWKFRAETSFDVGAWLSTVFLDTDYKLVDLHVCSCNGEPEVEFLTDDPLGTVACMHAVEDGHVMWETLAPSDKYTGERRLAS